ncbi:pathogen-related protein-like [Hordeum vulgare]|nr:pathogen-related protein-like [Hordeum vulgare]
MKPLTRKEWTAIGGYNAFLATKLPPEHRIYDPNKETVDSSMSMFLTAFPRGFAIEVDEEMKVEKAEYFYERGNFLASFLSAPVAASASGCPVMRGN